MKSTYSRSKLVDYIVNSLENGKNIERLSSEVAAYLIELGRTSELDSIMRDAQELRAQEYGTIELTARTSHKLDEAQIDSVRKLAKIQYGKARTVEIHEQHDESVVGGINLQFPHSSLDLTIRHRLNQLRESIS